MSDPKVVLVTGASSGIGQATARVLAENGYFVGMAARRWERLEALARELGERGLPLQCDVTDEGQVRAAVQELLDRRGRIDVLINNAGVMRIGPFLDQPQDNDRLQVETNLLGSLRMLRAVLPVMVRQGAGIVVNVSSILGRAIRPGAAVYVATKAGLIALTESLRKEFTRRNIRFLVVEPGMVRTELHPPAEFEQAIRSAGIQKPLEAEEIASAILYALEQPEHVAVSEILIRPVTQEL
ncbi:MAG: SDR family oxidoreductase [Planctomycetes bacterium]|nr:SDR family oxidoreductase [Planctomycetota bacterium]